MQCIFIPWSLSKQTSAIPQCPHMNSTEAFKEKQRSRLYRKAVMRNVVSQWPYWAQQSLRTGHKRFINLAIVATHNALTHTLSMSMSWLWLSLPSVVRRSLKSLICSASSGLRLNSAGNSEIQYLRRGTNEESGQSPKGVGVRWRGKRRPVGLTDHYWAATREKGRKYKLSKR